ncbi:MAG: GMC family oxidoreductase [Gammaproteobacteria bacterium]|nr:GMC family oxidoreductase [Gammaproteobacteria bacterium]MCP5136815.1 GMC family oxidoreductase [Gammaproteobacteria bacterium]
MIVDLDQSTAILDAGTRYDICICGSGFAGIALALRLPSSLKVLILEGGGAGYEERSQAVYQGRNVGHAYFDLNATRLRQFGGTSALWSGWCRPLDDRDFVSQAHIPNSGWPIGAEALAPYRAQAEAFLDVREHLADWGQAMPDLSDLRRIEFAWSSPTLRIADRYQDTLRESPNIDCLLNANLTDIRLSDDLSHAVSVEVRNYQGMVRQIEVGNVVLAAGGLENPRLLLNFNKQRPEGLGNAHDLVGRYFHEHPHFIAGNFILDDEVAYRLARAQAPGTRILLTQFLTPSDAFMRRHETLNFAMRVVHTNNNQGLDFSDKLRRLLCTTSVTRAVGDALDSDSLHCRQDPFFNGGDALRDGYIKLVSGSGPNPDSRVTLDDERDQFGLRRAQLDWRLGAIEKRTFRAAMMEIARQFVAHDLGRVQIYDWVLDKDAPFPGFPQEVAGHHHMGTTRMAAGPETGVVDSDQRVFGIDNLFVAGCSVFPYGGHANPTLTIVQMAMRLADHLARVSTPSRV